MTPDEFSAYLATLPPELQAAAADALKPFADYATRAVEVRAHIAREFPGLSPPFRAALSLALARYR